MSESKGLTDGEAKALLAMFVHFRQLAKVGNPIEQLWAEYYWRRAKILLADNGLRPRWDRKGRKWVLCDARA
jgi:hypothetical protein